MPRPPISLPSSRRSITLFASAVILLLFIWQGRKGYNIGDEGFLWYGVQRVLAGEVPLRDFMAYDPGRYYWSAALLALWGQEGIMQLRAVVAIFQTLGLAAALCLLDRANPATSATRRRAFMLVSALILVLWMFPRHKLFDTSLSIFLIGMLAALIRKPDQRHFLLLGIGIGLIYLFAVELRWLPSFGRGQLVDLGGWQTGLLTVSGLSALVLPAVTLGFYKLTLIMRLVRAEMLDVLRSDYIRFGRARGLRERKLHYRHALRNTLIPIITVIGLQLGSLIAFAIVTETVFQWPGLGLLFITSIQGVDVPVITAYLLFIALLYVTINLIVDLLYVWADPRLRRR